MAITMTLSRASGAEFRTNTYVPHDARRPDVLGLSNGGFATAYTSNSYVHVDFYNAGGQALTHTAFFDLPFTVGRPDLIELTNGTVLAAWDYSDAYIPGQLFTSTGAPIGTDFTVAFKGGYTREGDVTALAGGGIAVAFGNHPVSNGLTIIPTNVFMSRLDNAGNALSPQNAQVNTTLDRALYPETAGLADGGYIVAWNQTDPYFASPGNPPDPHFLRGRIYNADGTARTAEFLIDGDGVNAMHKVVALQNGNWAIVYSDTSWAEGGIENGLKGYGLTLQIFNATGGSVSGPIHVNNFSLADEVNPDITVLANGWITVTWTLPIGSNNNDIYGRIFSQDGVPLPIDGSNDPFVITSSLSNDTFSAVSHMLDGRFITAWQDTQSDGDGGQITSVINEIMRTTTGDNAADTFAGDALRDTIYGNGGADTLSGGGGGDTIDGGSGNDSLNGGSGDDLLIGGIGNDLLDGGTGIDTTIGGAGNDQYYVDNLQDTVIEQDGGGTDTVFSTTDYTLAPNSFIEYLRAAAGSPALNLTGNALANRIYGSDGDDTLDGAGGVDLLYGGLGNDYYVVRSPSTKVIEAANEGTDTVQSVVSYKLGAEVENLTLAGPNALIGTGNAAVNVIIGSEANNLLDGGAGADTMSGGDGNDRYYVDDAADVVTEFVGLGNDTVYAAVDYTLTVGSEIEALRANAGSNGLTLTGNSYANRIDGGAGDDTLSGGGGLDMLAGGAGDDLYVVETAGARISEKADAGDDKVNAWLSFVLPANVERLDLMGSFPINGTGNASANTILGNSAANKIDGAAGADTMIGGDGNDTYVVDNAADVVVETANQGTDTVMVKADYTLTPGAVVEILRAQSNGGLHFVGNELANQLIGAAGDDTLNGAAGDDTLDGKAGDDIFEFTAGFNHDTILGFQAGAGTDDVIRFDHNLFANFGDAMAHTAEVFGNTLIFHDAANYVILAGVSRNALHADDFTFL